MFHPDHKSSFIGLMSGTSLDGVDGVLVDFLPEEAFAKKALNVRAHVHQAFAPALRETLLTLNAAQGYDELHRAALAGNALALHYASAVRALLGRTHCKAEDVAAIGAHGQTVRHCPGAFDGIGYTVQLNQPALLAERTGIAVVADFRSRDVAAAGQGAPLVPAFHAAYFARSGQCVAVLNIGGMSNVSLLSGDGQVSGFDCGPGNVLMDYWCEQHRGAAFDAAGAWAASGTVNVELLDIFLQEPFFSKPPPKSTGRDLFSHAWLLERLAQVPRVAAQNIQATLLEVTARTCAQAVEQHARKYPEVMVVCGGGAFNTQLLQRLQALLPQTHVQTSEAFGLPPMQVEAASFAWLARQTVLGRTGNLPAVTGAQGPRVLGAIYPA